MIPPCFKLFHSSIKIRFLLSGQWTLIKFFSLNYESENLLLCAITWEINIWTKKFYFISLIQCRIEFLIQMSDISIDILFNVNFLTLNIKKFKYIDRILMNFKRIVNIKQYQCTVSVKFYNREIQYTASSFYHSFKCFYFYKLCALQVKQILRYTKCIYD
jgi:hypothetical protein